MKNPAMTIVAICLAIISTSLFAKAADATDPALEKALANRTWQGIPGLERTEKGRLFFTWFTGGEREPRPENMVLLCHSDDGGKTHSPLQIMAAPKDGSRCYDPTPWIDPKGRLWYIFSRSNKDTAEHGVYARICDNPDAPEPVFGPEFRIGFDVPFSFRMNKPTVLSTGEWAMPVTFSKGKVNDWTAGNKNDKIALQGVAISPDEGKTWKLNGAVEAPPWALEGMVTELKDGRLWLLIRTSSGYLYESFSTDKGATWSEGRRTRIANPGSRFFIRRLASGNLLMVNHFGFDPNGKSSRIKRSHLTAQLSTDDGETWSEGLLLDARQGVSYPDGVEDKDGRIWIIYDRARGSAGDILMAKFREEDVAQRKNVSGEMRLRRVINTLSSAKKARPKIAADAVMARMITVSAPQVKGAHDSHFAIAGNRAYVVSLANDVQAGESDTWDFVYATLSVVNLDTLKMERIIPVAKSGQAFENAKLPKGACFVPRILQKDENTLRVFFASHPKDGQSQIWFRDLNLRSGEFENKIHRMKLKTGEGVFDMQPNRFWDDAVRHGFQGKSKPFGMYMFSFYKNADGKTYLNLNNFQTKQNALAVLNDAMDTVEIIGHFNEPQSAGLSEAAINKTPNGKWMAIIRSDKGGRKGYHFATSADGKTWTQGETRPFAQGGGTSKPVFEKFDGVYYLGWQENRERTIFNIDVSTDCVKWKRKYRFENQESFQYPSLLRHNGKTYISATTGGEGAKDRRGKVKIIFGVLE